MTYLISDGSTKSNNFGPLLRLAEAAVRARISCFQIREKHLTGKELFDLSCQLRHITASSETRLVVNDRLDVAFSAGADGVQLTEKSVSAGVIRHAIGRRLVVGVSTHTLEGVGKARAEGADFAVFGPVFATPAKEGFGAPTGIGLLREAVQAAGQMPVLALGGVSTDNFAGCLAAGAAGVAGIRLFGDVSRLVGIAAKIRAWR